MSGRAPTLLFMSPAATPAPVEHTRVAGWPSEPLAATLGFGGSAGAPVMCSVLLGRTAEEAAVDDLLRLDDYPVRMPLRVVWEFADALKHTDAYPEPVMLERLWQAGLSCGALLAVFLMGQENSPRGSEASGAAAAAAYVEEWRARRYTITHAVWHIANGDADPSALREHDPRGCTPDSFATMWSLAGRTSGMDPIVDSALHWLRAFHVE